MRGAGQDQERRAVARLGRWRRQHIVNAEVAPRIERHGLRVVRRESRGGELAREARDDHLAPIRADAIAAGEEQAPAVDRDATVGPYIGREPRDRPGLATGRHIAHNIRSRRVGHRNLADAAIEADKAIVGRCGC